MNPDLFDNNSGSIKSKASYSKLNAYLTKELNKINDIILDIEYRNQKLTFENILNHYKSDDKQVVDFIEFCFTELENLKLGMAYKTYEDYCCSIRNLQEFSSSLSFDDINYEFLVRYEVWLKSVKKRGKNSRYHNFAAIRKFLNLAIKYGHTKNYPFEDFKFSQDRKPFEYLDESELKRLHTLFIGGSLPNKLQNTLTNFLFTCYTGVAGDDMRNKHRLNFNKEFLFFDRGKTGKVVKIPLTKNAKDLLIEIEIRNLKQSKSRTNSDLKEIMKLAGIDKHITYHMGRHTFATISLIKGISLSVISKVLGHTSTKTTEIYAQVVDELMNKEMLKWDE